MTYNTEMREKVIGFLSLYSDSSFSADEIAERIEIAKSTLYRLLSRLVEEQVVVKIAGREKSIKYQYRPSELCSHHMHIKCVRCGRIDHVEATVTKEIGSLIESSVGFRLLEQTLLEGICSSCRD